jgi:hypothetical protein
VRVTGPGSFSLSLFTKSRSKKSVSSINMASSCAGYVSIPRCPVIFDGTNYGEFATFMRIHMQGLRLWGVLTGEVSCPLRPIALMPLPRRMCHMPLLLMLSRLIRM